MSGRFGRMRHSSLSIVLLGVLLVCSWSPSHAQWRERRAALSDVHRVQEFRIFYSRVGQDALPTAEDRDHNDTPDYVDRIARELVSARDRYDGEFRLRHPLSSPRYRNQAEFIDVNLLAFPLSPGGPRHGMAYDELSSFDRTHDAGWKVRVLVIDISNNVPANNATAAHELFHLYQNGYTFFKNRWYTEGLARWAEQPGASGKTGRWPQSKGEIQELFRQSYEAAPFWRRVAAQMDPGGRNIVKALLDALDRMDDTVNAGGKWREADQMSSANDVYIWRALRETLEQPQFLSMWSEDVRTAMAIEP